MVGDFAGYENKPQAWDKIVESTVRRAGHGFLRQIPPEDFQREYFSQAILSQYTHQQHIDN
jgi:hypothetical protein